MAVKEKDEKRKKKKKNKKKSESLVTQSVHLRAAIEASRSSPYTGLRFPNGSKRIAFECYVRNNGSIERTRRELRQTKAIEGGRVPSPRTLITWVQEGHWDTLRHMIDDGFSEILNSSEDPDIKEIIKDDHAYFKVLGRLRSATLTSMMSKNSRLMPKSSNEATTFLKFLSDEMGKLAERGKDKASTSTEDGTKKKKKKKKSEDEEDSRVIDFAKRLAERNEPVTKSNVALAMLADRRK